MNSLEQGIPEIGCVVECIHNDKILIGIIQDLRPPSVYIYTTTAREIKVNTNRLLPWIGPYAKHSVNKQEATHLLQESLLLREQFKQNINVHELWECVVDELHRASIFELAELLQSSPSIDYVAALGRALLEHKEYFKFVSPYFEIYTREQYETKKKNLELQHNKQLQIDALRSIIAFAFQNIQKNITTNLALSPVDEIYKNEFIDLLHSRFTHSIDPEKEKVWKEIIQIIPVQEQESITPLIIGQILGIIPKHYNNFAHTAGYALEGWEEPYKDEIERLTALSTEYTFIDLPFISIDNETTKDIDDAFYLEEINDSMNRVHFAIALPVELWDYKSDLHKEVSTRATSLYLPEGTYNMLPDILAEDIYSISSKKKKNILYITADITSKGHISNITVSIATTIINKNTTYKECEDILQGKIQEHTWLRKAYSIAKELQEKRLHNGGIIIKREDTVIDLKPNGDDYIITIEQPETYHQSQLLVSEFMILANTAIVEFAKEHRIPLIHRVQECSTPTGNQRIWERPEEIHSVMKMLTSVSLDINPKKHSALGILGYATITSPLRRFVDFINEEQIFSWFIHGSLRYSEDALCATIPLIQRHTEQSVAIQRFRTRYWKLCFLKQHENEWFTGIFVEENNFIYIYLPIVQITVRVKHSLCGNKCILGESVELRCLVNPLQNELNVVELR